MICVSVEVPEITVTKDLEQAGKKIKPAIKQAVNELAKETKEAVYAKANEDYEIKRGSFKKGDLKLKKATTSRLVAEIKTSGGALGLKKAYRTKKNVGRTAASAKVKKSNPMKRLEKGGIKAFVSGVKAGGSGKSHTAIFQRSGKGRFPIKELKGPGIGKISEKVFEPMQEQTGRELMNRITAIAGELLNDHS